MAKWVKKEEDEQIVGELAEVGGAVYPIPEMDEIPPDASPVVGNWADHNRFDGWVAEVQYTFYDAPAGGSPYAQDQAISVARSDIAYGTNNDPVIHPTPSAALTPPDVPFGAVGNAKPFPVRHDQAAYHVATGDPVLVIPGKDNKNWFLSDEIPFFAEVTAVAAGVATVKRQSISGNPASAAPTLADLLDKDGSLVTYSYVKILKPNAGYDDFAVGDTVLVQRRGQYYFAIAPPLTVGDTLPDGTINARLGHDGTSWTALRAGVAKIVSNDTGGEYTIAEQMWDPDLSTPAWVHVKVTVTGDGDSVNGSPNGDYAGANFAGTPYYLRSDGDFTIWYGDPGDQWFIGTTYGGASPGWAGGTDIEDAYSPVGGESGNPVATISKLTARDISQNANGAADDYVLFWQQYDDNGDVETVIALATATGTTPSFTRDLWFDVTGDAAYADVDSAHDYRNRVVETAAFYDSGAPINNGSWNEDDVYIFDVNLQARAQADGQCQMTYVGGNTLVNYAIAFVDKTATLGDFNLRVAGTNGALQAESTSFQTRYQVRVRITAGRKAQAADAVDIS